MLIPKPFYRGFPPDGAVSGGAGTWKIDVFHTGAFVPLYKKWRVSSIKVDNATQIDGYYSIAFWPGGSGNPAQPDLGAVNADSLPKSSNLTAPLGPYIAYSRLVPASSSDDWAPTEAWGLSGEELMIGAYPGALALVGFGGVCVQVSGWEYRD